MIEFRGTLSGSAEKRFLQKARNLELNFFLVITTLCFPVVAYIGMITEVRIILLVWCSLYVVLPLLARVPKSKKERLAMMPQKICVEGSRLVCITGRATERRSVSDVKKIVDHGDFYEICFRFGRVSNNFICQKSLLTQGSLEAFEELFGEKILGYQVS